MVSILVKNFRRISFWRFYIIFKCGQDGNACRNNHNDHFAVRTKQEAIGADLTNIFSVNGKDQKELVLVLR